MIEFCFSIDITFNINDYVNRHNYRFCEFQQLTEIVLYVRDVPEIKLLFEITRDRVVEPVMFTSVIY